MSSQIPPKVQNLLSKYHPQVKSQLKKSTTIGRTRIEPARSGKPNLIVKDNRGEEISYHDATDPLRAGQIWAEEIELIPNSIVAIVGIGLGYNAAAFADLHANQARRFIFIEPDTDILEHTFSEYEWPESLLGASIIWLAGVPEGLDTQLMRAAADFSECNLTVLIHDSAKKLIPEACEVWERELRACAGRLRAGYLGMMLRGADAQRNVITNIPILIKSQPLDILEGIGEGKPVFIAGGGPSLDKNIGLLKEAVLHGPLISVDTAYDVLINNGIHPDLVITRDPTSASARKLAGHEIPSRSLLAFHAESYPDNALRGNASNRLWIRDGGVGIIEYISSELGSKVIVTRTTNVGHLAFCIAKMMKANPIVMTGMDLALGQKHGETHVTGSAYASRSTLTKDGKNLEIEGPQGTERVRLETVIGWDDETLLTLAQFKRYLHHLENEIRSAQIKVIDATEGGARKRGAERATLREVLDRLGPPAGTRNPLASSIRPNKVSAAAQKKLKRLLTEAQRTFENGRNALQWLYTDAKELVDTATLEDFEQRQDRLAEGWLSTYESQAFRTVVGTAGAKLTHRVAHTNPEPFRSVQEGLTWLRKTYASFLEEALDLLEEFNGRLEEALSEAE